MKDSILVKDQEHCLICGSDRVHRHHIYRGKNRKNADEDGMWVPLCMEHHTGQHGVHNSQFLDSELKELAQIVWERTRTREEFIKRYGKSYL